MVNKLKIFLTKLFKRKDTSINGVINFDKNYEKFLLKSKNFSQEEFIYFNQIWIDRVKKLDYSDPRYVGLHDVSFSGWYNTKERELVKGFKINENDKILDIGSGGGGASLFSASLNAFVTFADNDKTKLNNLTKEFSMKGYKFNSYLIEEEKFSLPDFFYDKIICLEVLEHVKEPEAMLKEIHRMLKNNGVVCLTVPDEKSEILSNSIAPKSYFEIPNHIHIFNQSKLTFLLNEIGFDIISIQPYGFFWNFWILIYWSILKEKGIDLNGEAHDIVQPPYPEILIQWTILWDKLLNIKEFLPIVQNLNVMMPKSNIYILRKKL